MTPHIHALAKRCCLVLALWCAIAGNSHAEPPSPPFEPTKVNLGRLRWLHYKLVAGRIVATSSYPEGMNISFGPSIVDGALREQLQLSILKERASIRYELSGGGESLKIGLTEAGVFSLQRTQHDPAVSLRFVQPPEKDLHVAITEGDVQRVVSGASFWHLYLAEPQWVAGQLIPYLEMLRPNWKLAALGAAVEETLVQRAQASRTPDTHRWQQLVAQLASANFSQRESAERELARLGQVVLPFLEGLDTAELDAEQVARVEKLIAALSVNYEDTVERVATWLAADRQIWLALLSRPEFAKRQVAAAQLTALTGSAIAFDPAAEEATRRKQLTALQLKLRSSTSRELPAITEKTDETESDSRLDSVPPPGVER